MKSLAASETLNADRSRAYALLATLNAQRCGVVILTALSFLLCSRDLHGQVGNNNPSGVSGIFNGQAGGCGYDPYTGNAIRSITDIAVAGAVGEYPLALVRTANSRTPSTTEVFGVAGGWNHNYDWILEESEHSQTQNFHPASYTVEFPDGRVETFKQVNWDPSCYRARASTGDAGSSAGVRERFVQLDLNQNNQTYLYAYLVLADGGKIEFKAVRYTNGNGRWWYKYHATAIYDPYGLKTQLVSSTTPNGLWRRLDWVIEPAGRSLQFLYTGTNSPRIASVTASDGRTVNYYYVYCNGCRLDNVVYYNNASWTARYKYCNSNVGQELPPLLWTCDDPMYAGPMRRVAYEYKTGNNTDGTTAVYGQIFRERYYDGDPNNAGNGIMVSALTIGASNPINHNIRTETRWDGSSRTFTYTAQGYLTWASDFMGHNASQGYDTYKYINYVTDRRNNRTDFTNDPITGNVTQIKYALTPEDTTGQGNTHPTVNYTYTNSYYLHTVRDEADNLTTITRDPNNNRVTRIDYSDGGYETIAYDAAHFSQPSSHRMVTGGTESWTYDAHHRKDTYRNPDNANGNPTARYLYDNYDRISDITDVLGVNLGDQNHTTSLVYNLRGQLTTTTLPKDPIDNVRRTIINTYNDTGPNAGDGTLVSVTDQLNHVTSYTYDDYRRLRSVTPPMRGSGDNDTHTTWLYYDDNGVANDYKFTDPSVSWVKLPSGKKIHTVYDDNRSKSSVTGAPGTADEATTSYLYDAAGNVTWITNPLSHNNVHTLYDARNRPYQITVGPSQTTNIAYDTAGRRKEIVRPNGQVITYDSFDAMNRVTQQTATNTRLGANQNIRTSYSYYPSGPANLLNTFQDPHLFGGGDQYTYYYDGMGRKTSLQYPLNGNGVHRSEQWSYDAVGRLYQFTNRDFPAQTQTFYYDALNRMISFTWSDNPTTPNVSFSYDIASRLTGITNANAVISRTYFNDNLLKSETETATGGVARAVNYTYDADGNRGTLGIPGYTFNYHYTNRNQLQDIVNANNATIASYVYDVRGNVTSRSVISNSTSSDYNYDLYDRVTSVNHNLASGTRSIQYGYDDANHSNNRLWAKRVINAQSPENSKGEVFSYDLADQVSAFQLNALNPNQVSQPLSQTMLYDPNGNRQFTPAAQYGAVNDLSQYTTRTIAGNQTTAAYDPKGNTTTGLDGSTYTDDAQNRLLTAQKSGGSTMTFKYDGLNRQVSRRLGNGTTYYGVWDGSDLVEDYHKSGSNAVVDATYVYGATGLVRDMENPNHYYYQDASGSISHLANNNGTLVEWYRYDLDGNPSFYDSTDHVRFPNQSGYSVRHLFTGQQWYHELGLYDLRNRFYSPDLGRFLQPDPIGFGGGKNLYRYCGNNPVTRRDPFGLQGQNDVDGGGTATLDPVIVHGAPIIHEILVGWPGFGSPGGFSGPGEFGLGGHMVGDKFVSDFNPFPRPRSPSAQHTAPSNAPEQNPPTPTLANSPATTLLGKFLQSFNSQGGWSEMASAMDTFAGLAASSLLFGEGGVNWAVGRYVLPATVRATFLRGTIQSTVLRKPMTVFRYSGGRSPQIGSYFTTADTVAQISSPNSASIALALPEGNTAATLTEFTIPAGTRVYFGGVAGGADTATQVYVLNPDVIIIGAP